MMSLRCSQCAEKNGRNVDHVDGREGTEFTTFVQALQSFTFAHFEWSTSTIYETRINNRTIRVQSGPKVMLRVGIIFDKNAHQDRASSARIYLVLVCAGRTVACLA